MHQPSSYLARGLLLALPMTLCTALASAAPQAQGAATDLQRVEVTGRSTAADTARVDVRRACPGVDKDLPTLLAPAIYREGRSGQVRVHFRLKGDQISEVSTSGRLTQTYRQPIRNAMQRVDCNRDGHENQLYTFLINFNAKDDGTPESYRVALLEQ